MKRLCFCLINFCICLICICPVKAQRIKTLGFETITVEDRNLKIPIRSILQDEFGVFWLGTPFGLYSYDGYEVESYAELGLESLKQAVKGIDFDSSGRIWVASDNQLAVYDPRQHSAGVHGFTKDVQNADDVTCLLALPNQQVLLGTEKGLFLLSASLPDSVLELGLSFKAETQPILEAEISDLVAVDSVKALIGTSKGLFSYSWRSKTLEVLGIADPIKDITIENPTSALVLTTKGIWHWEGAKGLTKGLEFSDFGRVEGEDLRSVVSNGEQIWVGSNNEGLFVLHADTTLVHYKKESAYLEGNANINIYELFRDRTGQIWLGTWDGLQKAVETRANFTYLRVTVPGYGLSNNGVMDIMRNRITGDLWIATKGGGINIIDEITGELKLDPLARQSDEDSAREIWDLHQDNDGNIWVANWGRGIHIIRTDGTIDYVSQQSTKPFQLVSENKVHAIYQDSRGSMWFSTADAGIEIYNESQDSTHNHSYVADSLQTVGSNDIVFVYEDSSENVWVATDGAGLSKYNLDNGYFERITDSQSALETLGSVFVTALLEFPRDTLWIGTQGGGLSRMKISTGEIERLYSTELPFENVVGIESDSKGYLWLSTYNHGLIKLDPKTLQHVEYGSYDGIQSGVFYVRSHFKDRNGELFFGGAEGLNSFFPAFIVKDLIPPQVVFSSLEIDGVEQFPLESSSLDETIRFADQVVIHPDQKEIKINFSGLHYKNPQKNEYTYQLKGYQDSVRTVGRERSVTFSRDALPPKAYELVVNASNSDAVWSENAASLTINVLPDWYEKWWARLLFSFAGLVFVMGIVRLRVRSLQQRAVVLERTVSERTAEIAAQNKTLARQAEQLKEMDKIKSNFFANISHEFRTPLTTIIGPVQDTLRGMHGPLKEQVRILLKIVERSGATLNELIDQLLALAKLESGEVRVNPRRTNLAEYVRHRLFDFKLTASRSEIDLKFVAGPSVPDVYIDTEKLKYIFNNLMSNALKFTPVGGQIEVRVEHEPQSNGVKLSVSDTGEGIAPDVLPHIFNRFHQGDASSTRLHEGTGIGLALTKELVTLHQATVTVESQLGNGSTFTVHFKGGIDHFPAASVVDRPWVPETLPESATEYESFLGEQSEEELPDDASSILVVEDREEVRQYVISLLEGRYQIFEAINGREGLEKALEVLPDLIVSDVMMPEVDGIQMVKAIKNEPALSDTRIMLLTARAEDEDIHAGLRTGADAYIVKPFNATEFQIRVENLIEVRKALAANRVNLGPNSVEVDSIDAAFIKEVRALIEGRMQDIKVSDIAYEVSVSVRHLNRRIKEITGLTAGGYLQFMRLERAAQLLEQNHDQIAQIGYKVGYKDPSHFSRVFRQAHDVTPKEYMEGKRGG